MAILKTQIKIRRDTAANLANIVLGVGEPAYATDTKKLAIGDGVTVFSNLRDYGAMPDMGDYISRSELDTLLSEKADSSHTHTVSEITDLTPIQVVSSLPSSPDSNTIYFITG